MKGDRTGPGHCAMCGTWHTNYRHGGAVWQPVHRRVDAPADGHRQICHPCALRLISATARRLVADLEAVTADG